MGGGEITQLHFHSEVGSLYPVSVLSGDPNVELPSLNCLFLGFGFVFLRCFVVSSIFGWRTELSVNCSKLLLGPQSCCK